jgi:hypothetical protein
VEGLAAVRLVGLDPQEHATGPMIYEQLQKFFTEAVNGKQPWRAIVDTWPEWVQQLDSVGVRYITRTLSMRSLMCSNAKV